MRISAELRDHEAAGSLAELRRASVRICRDDAWPGALVHCGRRRSRTGARSPYECIPGSLPEELEHNEIAPRRMPLPEAMNSGRATPKTATGSEMEA